MLVAIMEDVLRSSLQIRQPRQALHSLAFESGRMSLVIEQINPFSIAESDLIAVTED